MKKTSAKVSGSLLEIPGVGKSIARDLHQIGIRTVGDLKGKDPETLFALSNEFAGQVQDRCLLYVFRGAVYYASGGRDPEKLKWWNWKDGKQSKT
jgi:hypothetical protein